MASKESFQENHLILSLAGDPEVSRNVLVRIIM